ncbi:hypothetical protein FHY55_06430 [Oceanicola sp. D3]|uniref:hypothetical protein n=1 Tax=Oceanicola sp. D3 TaxID=2587163 RepID=UPI00111CF41F|nr:hypothetical protein [Oceanicola sp. D3]QDC08900.1 hypothetical protein FHY55_06430 [Oceanicola sp. D3]
MPLPVTILYAKGHAKRGSVTMRAMQLAKIGQRHLKDFDVTARSMPQRDTGEQIGAVRDITEGVVILCKAMIQHVDHEVIEHLKSNGVAVAADWIDKAPRSRHMAAIDLHIGSSRKQVVELVEKMPGIRVAYVTHHWDVRLQKLEFAPLDRLRMMYLGRPENTAMPDGVEAEVLQAETSEQFEAVLARLPEFNLHYAVRADDTPEGICKPFTKGFTAAACQSNIILQPDVDDAVSYLGADYPYFVANDSPEAVQDMLKKARDEFGGPVWAEGLERMRDVAHRASPRQVARELGAAVEAVAK